MTKLDELKKKHKVLKDQIRDESKSFFKEASAGIFEKYPAITHFSWAQYTPYFNDGDECVFNVHSDPKINGVDIYERDENGEDDAKGIPEKAWKDIQKLIDSIDTDTMKEMFGDHCEVIAKRDGITVEEYEHD